MLLLLLRQARDPMKSHALAHLAAVFPETPQPPSATRSSRANGGRHPDTKHPASTNALAPSPPMTLRRATKRPHWYTSLEEPDEPSPKRHSANQHKSVHWQVCTNATVLTPTHSLYPAMACIALQWRLHWPCQSILIKHALVVPRGLH